MVVQTLKPVQLVGEFLGIDRVAVRQVDRGHAHRFRSFDQGLDITGLFIAFVTGQAAHDIRHREFGQQRNAVIALLPIRLDIIAKAFKGLAREFLVDAFDLLKTGDIGLSGFKPRQHGRQAGIDRVHVPGGYTHKLEIRPSAACPIEGKKKTPPG